MTCPKCHGEMRHYERSGVTVDQCTECRGIFLDRGELERLVEAENTWRGSRGQEHAAPPPGGYPQPGYPQQPYQQPRHDDRHYGHGYREHGHHKRKRKESFFEQLFD